MPGILVVYLRLKERGAPLNRPRCLVERPRVLFRITRKLFLRLKGARGPLKEFRWLFENLGALHFLWGRRWGSIVIGGDPPDSQESVAHRRLPFCSVSLSLLFPQSVLAVYGHGKSGRPDLM